MMHHRKKAAEVWAGGARGLGKGEGGMNPRRTGVEEEEDGEDGDEDEEKEESREGHRKRRRRKS
jgi:hypothetical protein